MKINDGGPAFPHDGRDNGPGNIKGRPHDGMTLRDWFAGRVVSRAFEHNMAEGDRTVAEAARISADWSYAVADAMIAARAKGDA